MPSSSFFVFHISTKKCFSNWDASALEMLVKFGSVLYFAKYHDCKQRRAVLVLFCVFSEAIFSLKTSSSSSVYVTIETGSSSLVAEVLSLVSVAYLSSTIFSFAIDCCRFLVLVSVSGLLENLSRKS